MAESDYGEMDLIRGDGVGLRAKFVGKMEYCGGEKNRVTEKEADWDIKDSGYGKKNRITGNESDNGNPIMGTESDSGIVK